jgi:hypothetical protein
VLKRVATPPQLWVISFTGPKPDPERIYLARRAAILSILTGSGASGERAETLVTAWEAEATARGLPRDAASFWSGAVDWIADRRWGGRRVMHGA